MSVVTTARHRRIRYICGIEQPRVADGRGSESRLFRRRVEAFVSEMGGEAALSEFDKSQIGQLATIEVRIASIRKSMMEGDHVASDELIRLSSESRRILSGLRAKMKAKPEGPSLAEYLAQNYGTAAT